MKLSGMTVSVGYADVLRHTLPKWLDGVDDCLVVTSPEDEDTKRLCRHLQVRFYETWAFYWRNADFNKGWAMAEGYQLLNPQGWMLFFDADVAPPKDWKNKLPPLEIGKLYGATRAEENGNPFNDEDMAGFFHLAHAIDDQRMWHRPIVDTHWAHAGNYDSTFQDRWPKSMRTVLPLTLTHYGDPGKNWRGVGHSVHEIHAERLRRGGKWDHETVGNEVGSPRFRHLWFDKNIPHLAEWIGCRRFGQGLEIGSFEGRSAYHWLTENIVDRLTCVDPWTSDWSGGSPHLMIGAETAFDENVLRRYTSRVTKIKGHSQNVLPQLRMEGHEFDFIYVDGNHEGMWALTDLVFAWLMLAPGGFLLFDDYGWHDPECWRLPKDAMDSLLDMFAPQISSYKISNQEGVRQVGIWKK